MKRRKVLDTITPYIAGKLKPGAIKLASNENPLGPSPKAIEAISQSLQKIHIYPDSNCLELKLKLAEKHGLKSEQVIIGNGSDEILLFITGAYMEKGRSAIAAKYTFPEYTFSTYLFDGNMVYVKMDNLRHSLEKFYSKIDSSTAIIFLCNPNNPSGTYFSDRELKNFLGKISSDILVIIDEAYYEYVDAQDFPNSIELLKEFDNLLILRTFSKIYGLAGLRIGYAMGSEKLIGDLNLTREPFNVNSLAQLGAMAALKDQEHVEKSKMLNRQGKAYLYEQFDKLGLTYWPTEANFVFFRCGLNRDDVFKNMMDMGITIRSLPVYDDSLRVTIGTMEENRLFISYLTEILKSSR
ncbi:MAG: histidinol-phosphate transaminase [Spirochaetales bacterium]|nr:histidinol-phosphate transaminase [Spirochaetales bacterium]